MKDSDDPEGNVTTAQNKTCCRPTKVSSNEGWEAKECNVQHKKVLTAKTAVNIISLETQASGFQTVKRTLLKCL